MRRRKQGGPDDGVQEAREEAEGLTGEDAENDAVQDLLDEEPKGADDTAGSGFGGWPDRGVEK